MDVYCIIEEAKCCSGNLAAKYTQMYVSGTDCKKTMFELQALNGLVKTLERYQCQKENFYKKEKCLPLGTNDWIRDNGVCLQEQDLIKIVQKIKLLCSNCNCNCN